MNAGRDTTKRSMAWVSESSSHKNASVVICADGVLAGLTGLRSHRTTHSVGPRARSEPLGSPARNVSTCLVSECSFLLTSRANGSLILFLAYTRRQWGEAVVLRVRRVDMFHRRVHVRAKAVDRCGTFTPDPPKSHESRSVPLPMLLADQVAKRCEGKSHVQLIFGDGEAPPDFHTERRLVPWRSKKVAGRDFQFPERLTLHDFRNNAALLASSAGTNVRAVQRMLGLRQRQSS
jgi:hypothetical protein